MADDRTQQYFQKTGQPTREEFEKAAKEITESAPPGMSRDEFFAAIDRRIANNRPKPEPTLKGFMGNLAGNAIELPGEALQGILKVFSQDPGKTVTDVGAGLKEKAKGYYKDPLGTIYNKPADFLADVATVGQGARMMDSILKAPGQIRDARLAAFRDQPLYKQMDRLTPKTPKGGGGGANGNLGNVGGGRPVTPPPSPMSTTLSRDALSPKLNNEFFPEASDSTSATSRAPVKSAEDSIYEALMNKLGGGNKTAAATPTPRREMVTLYRGGKVPGEFWTDNPDYARNFGRSGELWKTEVPADKLDDYVYRRKEAPGGEFEYADAGQKIDLDDPMPDMFSDSGVPGAVERVDRQYRIPLDDPAHERATPAGSFSDNMRNPSKPGEWHTGAEPGSADAKSARALHRDVGEMDAGYRRRIADEKGSVPAGLFMTLAKLGLMKGVGMPGAVARGAIKSIPYVAEPAIDAGLISRIVNK